MDAVEEIKSRLNIEDIVGEYVQLKRAGRNYKGLSPFNSEKTPSFMVSPEKGIWHDFSSGKGGDLFSFIMETEGLDFKEALELLADKANVDLEQFRKPGVNGVRGRTSHSLDKNRLYEINEIACKFYQVQFSKSQVALDYVFNKRQFSKQVVLDFKIGYSPNTGAALINYMNKQGFETPELTMAGLTSKDYRGGVQDMFRGRLMIALADQQGRIIGFTARQLDDNPNTPKYINTPQTTLYDKSRHIYGLHLAKEALRKDGFAVLVEGNLDVIASHQAGVRNAVATAGTALTEYHLKGIRRFTEDIRLAFDQDRAGQNATERAIPIASKVGVKLSMITIPEGKDPDELIKKSPDLWRDSILKPEYAVDWILNLYAEQLDLNKSPDAMQFSDKVLGIVRQLKDSVEQDHYINKIAGLLNVSKDAVRAKLGGAMPATRLRKVKSGSGKAVSQSEKNMKKIQDQILCIGLMRPSLRELLTMVDREALLGDDALKLLDSLLSIPDFDDRLNTDPGLKEILEYSKVLALQYETMYQDLDDNELKGEMIRMHARLIEQYVKSKKLKISEELVGADEATTLRLLKQAKALDEKLRITN